MTKIHEIIPVETDRVNAANALVGEAVNTFSKKADHFLGQRRRVIMYDEARQAENTEDVKEVAETVDKAEPYWKALQEGRRPERVPGSAPALAEDFVLLTQEILTSIDARERAQTAEATA